MSDQSRHKAIRDRFKTLIDDPDATLNVAYDNLDDPHEDDDALWCRLTVLDGQTQVVESGVSANNRERTPGALVAQLFAKVGTGNKAQNLLAASIKTAFSQQSVADSEGNKVKFGASYQTTVGRSRDDKWWQVNVTCPYTYDDTPT